MARTSLFCFCTLLVGCAPHQAEITGTFTAWLAKSSSATADEGTFNVKDAVIFDCTGEPMADNQADCGALDPRWATWLEDDAYYVIKEDIDAWRVEAIMTAENDFQITFHHALNNGEDLRVAFVVDPDFEPKECTANDDGSASMQQVDGADWVEKWSEDEDGSYIYYLNAGSYQYGPYSDDYWDLPPEWLSGFGHAKFAADEFYSKPSDFGDYDVSEDLTGSDDDLESWYSYVDADNPDMNVYQDLIDTVAGYGEARQAELVDQGMADDTFTVKMEDNTWRPLDSSSAGLDGWVQLDYSWVRLDRTGGLEVGDAVSGDFQIYFEALESDSRLLVTGQFQVDKIHSDRWGYPDLMDEMREENNTPTCD